jgi:uncharacterized membrane protein
MSVFKFSQFIRIAIALMFIASGIYHFYNTDFFLAIMPEYMPWPKGLVLLSGITEIIAGGLFLLPGFIRLGAVIILIHLVVFLIVHIDMIQNAERFPDLSLFSLWIRLIIQGFLIFGVYYFTRRPKDYEINVAK